jgi:hypothetical protein
MPETVEVPGWALAAVGVIAAVYLLHRAFASLVWGRGPGDEVPVQGKGIDLAALIVAGVSLAVSVGSIISTSDHDERISALERAQYRADGPGLDWSPLQGHPGR